MPEERVDDADGRAARGERRPDVAGLADDILPRPDLVVTGERRTEPGDGRLATDELRLPNVAVRRPTTEGRADDEVARRPIEKVRRADGLAATDRPIPPTLLRRPTLGARADDRPLKLRDPVERTAGALVLPTD